MMRILPFSIILFFLLNSCTSYKYKKKGFVAEKNYDVEIPFNYEKGCIFIKIKIQGKSYHFLFDTGAGLNLIDPTVANQLKLKTLKKGNISNSNNSAKRIERVEINKIDIGGIEFQNSTCVVWDISKFSKHIRCEKIDGIIGNNLMRKASWQIDYKNQVIRISDNIEKFSISKDSKRIKMNSGKVGNVYLNLEINENKIPFTFDTGFNGFAQTGDTTILKNTFFMTKIGLNGVDFTGITKGVTHHVKFDNFKINNLLFHSPSHFLIKPNNSSILGNEFYENYIVTIDWKNDYLILDPHNEINMTEIDFYDVSFSTNYEKGWITISKIYDKSTLIDKVKPNTRVLKINNVDLVELKKSGGICQFWSNEWNEIKKNDILKITIEQDGILQDIEVKKLKNIW